METQLKTQAKGAPTSSVNSVSTGLLQQKYAKGESPEHNRRWQVLQRRSLNQGEPLEVPPIVNEVLHSPGQPLDVATSAFMESRFGHDFSKVSVHTDAKAAESTRAVSAMAYTVGQDIIFGAGQYAPGTTSGRQLIGHELAHVVQQAPFAACTTRQILGQVNNEFEHEADQAAAKLREESNEPIQIRPAVNSRGRIQRFSSDEHREIGKRAYEEASSTAPSGDTEQSPINSASMGRLREFLPTSLSREQSGAAQLYGQLVAAADNFASFKEMEEHTQQRTGIPILSPIWNWIGDSAHYVDLAARNRQHFHPHNFMSWQRWHWTALRTMLQAYQLGQQSKSLNEEVGRLFRGFDEHAQRGRDAIIQLDAIGRSGSEEPRRAELERMRDQEIAQMEQILPQMRQKQQQYQTVRTQASNLALRAMAMNGFGDHFLTDAFAGGHIVTPRKELLDEYATRLFGVLRVGGVLQCANIPSLAWHDLDNRFGVKVDNMAGDEWLTFGDDYANSDELPLGQSRSPTLLHVVKATAGSIRQMWEAAAGNMPTDLSPVLNEIPRPKLGPDEYPRWRPDPAQAWDTQLRFAAGEPVGETYEGVLGSSTARPNRPREQVPNPKGHQIGSGLLSARATCWNLTSVFSYDRFVVPMIERIRRESTQRFFYGKRGQIVSPDETPTAQESVRGSVVAGSIIGGILGGLAGAGIGLLAGGPLGAIIGGVVGLAAGFLGGGFIGGLIGEPREGKPAT